MTEPHSKGSAGASAPLHAPHEIFFSKELTLSTGEAVCDSDEPQPATTASKPNEIAILVALRDFLMAYLLLRGRLSLVNTQVSRTPFS